MKVLLTSKNIKRLSDIPAFPCAEPGLTTKNCGWRNEKPVCDNSKCNSCYLCYLYCPDGVISKLDSGVEIDYDFCKGCGICEKICKKGAITMKAEK